MAKRKRLTPPAPQDVQRAPEVKGMFLGAPEGLVPQPVRNRLSGKPAPIADMAGASAATAALEEVSAELTSARAEGRLVMKLPLSAIDGSHLMRDRMFVDSDDMMTLMTSLRSRGQQTPIEVLETSPGHYGLISGWRRLTAMRQLNDLTEGKQFTHILAFIRTPASAQDAYLSMVEENEVRVGLSYYERAQIVVRTVQAGVYPNDKRALQTLFSNASRAKRSKIKSFIPIVEALGDVLKFPAAISERVGLELSQKLDEPSVTKVLHTRLKAANPETAEAEQAMISAYLNAVRKASKQSLKSGLETSGKDATASEALTPELNMTFKGNTLKLTGAGVTPALADRIRTLLKPS